MGTSNYSDDFKRDAVHQITVPGYPIRKVSRRLGVRHSLYKWMKLFGEYDYNNVRPHSSLGNKTPAEARRTLEQFEGSAHDALAQTDNDEYKNQTRKVSF